MRHVKKLLSLIAATMLVAACTDNSLTNPFNNAAGTYQLTVWAGHSPGFQFTQPAGVDAELPNGGTVVINGGTLELNENGTFVETNNFTKTPPGGQSFNSSFVSSGTYNVSGTSFSLTAPPQNNFQARSADGTIEFDTVSYVEDGFSYEYRR